MNRDELRALADALTGQNQPAPEPDAPPEPPTAPVIDGQADRPDTDLPADELDARNAVDNLFGIHHRTPGPTL